MLSFRKKIIISDLIIFLLIVAFISPFVNRVAKEIIVRSISKQAKKLIVLLEKGRDTEEMVEIMKTNSQFVFERATLLDGEGNVIYYSFSPFLHPQERDESALGIEEAKKYGQGFSESFSPLLNEQYAYFARAFQLNGQKYILQLSISSYATAEIANYFKLIFTVLFFLIVLLYGCITWLVIRRLTHPIQQIVEIVSTYQEGKVLPHIVLDQKVRGSEFNKLAFTLNSLSRRIEGQIENLIQQREETETILDTLEEGIIATDTSARITFINQSACKLLGTSKDAILRQTLAEAALQPADLSKKCHELIIHALQTSEPLVQSLTLRDGELMYLELISTPLAHQNGALIVVQNKTSDYKMVEMGKDFVANASHELRTPITIIRGFAETLQDLPELSEEMLKEITEKIVRTCGRLDKLVRSLLTLSDIENLSQDRLKKGDLIFLAENCKHHLLVAHPEVKITLKTELETAPILTDPDLLDLAILNLLENAVKYSKAPAVIEMSIFQNGNELNLQISDEGSGIPESDLTHIFERFYTVDKARSRKLGGAGLGLSIVKTIVQKHKGRVTVHSELGKGSVFTIILPLLKDSKKVL